MPKTLEQLWIEDARLKLIQVLYESESPLKAKTVHRVLDQFNYSFTWDDFLRQVSWMVSEELIRCFPDDLAEERNEVDARKYVGLCLRTSFDSREASKILLKIRSKARHFLEGNEDGVKGVARP
jgi:hypothetical protein